MVVADVYRLAHVLVSSRAADSNWTFHFSKSSTEEYFWTGISIMLVGNTLSAIGLLVQKYAHNPEVKGDAKEWKCCGCDASLYCTSPMWLCGFSVFIVAQVLCFVALALGPQAVLACLTGWSTVVTFVLAPIFLGETVTMFRLLSVCIMIVGCLWVVLTGPRLYTVYTVEVMLVGMQNILFHILTGLALCYLLGSACMAALSSKSPRLSALQYTTIAAILGWYSVLSAKITSGLFFSSWHHTQNQFDRWESWGMLIMMIVLAVSNLHFINMALSTGDAVYVVPVYETMAIFGQTLLGGIFFNEFQHLDTYQQINFWLGISLVLLAMISLAVQGPGTSFFQYPVIEPSLRSNPNSPQASPGRLLPE